MQAIREGLLWILPSLMIISLILFVASLGEFIFGKDEQWVKTLFELYYFVNELFPILLTAALAYILAMRWRLPRPPIALVLIVYLSVFNQLVSVQESSVVFELLISLVTPLYAVPMIAYIYGLRWVKFVTNNHLGRIVKESLNLILPCIVVGIVVLVINTSLILLIESSSLLTLFTLNYSDSPLEFGVIFAMLNSFFWFLGVHGYYALLPLVDILQNAVDVAQYDVMTNGSSGYFVNHSFMAVFTFVGGAGSTLGLVMALLLFSNNRAYRLIAMASLPLGMLNINEVLLFGLPIIFNPRLFIPFLLAPVANTVVAYLAVSLGWVAVPVTGMPFSSPVFVNAWIVTQGDINASLLQLFNIGVSCLVYAPFVLLHNRTSSAKTIPFSSFDTTYSRRAEEAHTLSDDRVGQLVSAHRHQQDLESKLHTLSDKEFCLEYQPQVCRVTGQVIGCEALIRSMDKQGSIEYPGTFLPAFEQAGLMKDIDRWAVIQVVHDLKIAIAEGWAIPTSVNLTPETILDADLMEQITAYISRVGEYVHVEITEESLLKDRDKVEASLHALHKVGAKIYIDDFGSGFSSLSYLTMFDVDAIKLDRSFIHTIENIKGQKVFNGLISVAQDLDLAVVVEGVETEAQLERIPLRNHLSIQGWYYSKSIPLKALREYITTRNMTNVELEQT
ncbi:PTS sugar transporter subunit IIC/EAL domain-containing protein [Vibrio sp. 404]|uniref:PTS sugar transporter subunit IIC/EAL domain-containing protein n=1 Tax=Vibrio marinisediminis TaxID=2758441 RepID=A0A7W2FR32_9VIBR|nr:PTS sugar transporter subunit IIC/EAL domain-containing protein [Vibrio marinisediminis]